MKNQCDCSDAHHEVCPLMRLNDYDWWAWFSDNHLRIEGHGNGLIRIIHPETQFYVTFKISNSDERLPFVSDYLLPCFEALKRKMDGNN